MKNKTSKKIKGFTLLEILLVIAAIGILAAIVLVAINPNRQIAQVRNADRRSEVNTLYKALEQYLIDTRDYPAGITTTDKKDICNTGTNSVGQGTVGTNCVDLRVLVPTYLAAIPTDPSGGAYKVYKNSENGRIGVEAPGAELGQKIVINPQPPTPEELIQTQINEGTLLVDGTQKTVLGRLVYKNNAGTQTYIDKATTTRTCPANYIPVPGNSMYGTSDFCVMKYEAKNGSSTVAATATATGTPVNITQTNAATACSLNGAGYGLINNNEWMTIARNIEGQGGNWTGGAVGSGGLWRGHSDGSPFNSLEASTDDNLGYTGTNNTSPSIEKRTHVLSNGQTIWDISGNVSEWTSDTIQGENKPNNNSGYLQNWSVFNTGGSYGELSYDLTRPSNPNWDSSQNMGKYWAGSVTGTTTFAFLRGGDWYINSMVDASYAGVFNLNFDRTTSYGAIFVGFRCVLR